MDINMRQAKEKHKIKKGNGTGRRQSVCGQGWGLTSGQYTELESKSNRDMDNPCEGMLNRWYTLNGSC